MNLKIGQDIFANNGIVTLESFQHKIKSVVDLKKIIGELNAEFIWNKVP